MGLLVGALWRGYRIKALISAIAGGAVTSAAQRRFCLTYPQPEPVNSRALTLSLLDAESLSKLATTSREWQNDVVEAWKIRAARFRSAAEKGDFVAAHEYGLCCYYGRGVPLNYREAARCFGIAATKHHPPALYYRGICERDGRGLDRRNYNRAIALFREGVKRRDPDCTWALAQILNHGIGPIPRNAHEAENLIHQAAQMGHTKAEFLRGTYHRDGGEQRVINPDKAAYWFGLAAKKGYRPAMQALKALRPDAAAEP